MSPTADLIVFFLLAALAIISAVMMLASRHAVYSALFLVFNFLVIAILFLLLHAPFIALIQITVYAGAIMVLFLFVIMLLGLEKARTASRLKWQAPSAIVLAVVLAGTLAYAVVSEPAASAALLQPLQSGFGSPAQVGELLFNQYLVPFEVTSVLLLVAMVGAIFLSTFKRKSSE
jgi:NADH-quinone oxidoreductase subunit J